MKGVILAAGKGTRLYPITQHIAKPILPMVNRPTLAYAFDRLKEADIRDLCLVVGENETQIRDLLGDGSEFDVSLNYVRQHEPKGLAHALGFAQDFIAGDSFCLYLGDAIYSHSIRYAVDRFTESQADQLTLVKPVEDPRRFGVVVLEGEGIVKLVEKPVEPISNLAIAGFYLFNHRIWDVLPGLQPSARGEYEITDAIQAMVDAGCTALASVYEESWFDTGTLDSYLETTAFLTGGSSVIDPSSSVEAEIFGTVVVGQNATVRARSLEDCVILAGANVHVQGEINHSILCGNVGRDTNIENEVVYGEIC